MHRNCSGVVSAQRHGSRCGQLPRVRRDESVTSRYQRPQGDALRRTSRAFREDSHPRFPMHQRTQTGVPLDRSRTMDAVIEDNPSSRREDLAMQSLSPRHAYGKPFPSCKPPRSPRGLLSDPPPWPLVASEEASTTWDPIDRAQSEHDRDPLRDGRRVLPSTINGGRMSIGKLDLVRSHCRCGSNVVLPTLARNPGETQFDRRGRHGCWMDGALFRYCKKDCNCPMVCNPARHCRGVWLS
jgi:hypothetical protein